VASAPPGPPDSATAPPAPAALVIRGGYVLTMDPAAGDLPAADVHIAGGQIVAVGPGLAVPPGTQELDAAGMIVAPGLVDTHWHMWNTLLRSMSADPSGPGYFKVMIGAGRACTGEPNLGVLTDPAHLLVTAAQPANVDTVIVDGRVLKRAGELTTIDLPQVRSDAQRALAGLRARVGG